jgi:hypothetical protein
MSLLEQYCNSNDWTMLVLLEKVCFASVSAMTLRQQ